MVGWQAVQRANPTHLVNGRLEWIDLQEKMATCAC